MSKARRESLRRVVAVFAAVVAFLLCLGAGLGLSLSFESLLEAAGFGVFSQIAARLLMILGIIGPGLAGIAVHRMISRQGNVPANNPNDQSTNWPRRSQLPGLGKWIGLFACAVTVLFWLATLRWELQYQSPAVGVRVANPFIALRWPNNPNIKDLNLKFERRPFPMYAFGVGRLLYYQLVLPRAVRGTLSIDLAVPIWMVLLAFLVPTIVLWRIDRRTKPKPDSCAACGYNLTGNLSGRCPECGKPP